MGAIGHDGLAVPGRVELAHEPPFHLGILDVEPATRQLKSGSRSETIEPRVMQVLVALFRAGTIVTREELIARCWDGRVVGDDAINRVLSRIRHIAAEIGQDSFSVETITKVGYRLHADGDAPAHGVPAGGPVRASRRKLMGSLVGAGAVVAAGGTLAWQMFGSNRRPPQAEELYQRALGLRISSTDAENRQVIAYLREAVRIAPDFGEAWGALAFAYRGALGVDADPAEVAGYADRMQEAIRQADRYDPGNADAAFARRLGGGYFGRWSDMEPVYRDLARQYPKHPVGHYLLGTLLMDVGRWKDAIVALQAAKDRNAHSPMIRYKLTVALWSAGHISDAEHEIDDALRWSMHSAIWQTKIKLLAMTGRPQAALAVLNDVAVRPAGTTDDQLRRWRLFITSLISRAPDDVGKALAGLVQYARQDHVPVPQAFQIAMLGDRETALDVLEGCYLGVGSWGSKRPADPSGGAAHPLFQPQARTLWNEVRFGRILEGIGIEQYWRSTGKLPDYRRR
ncbi:winged helix-turn-helix domain-containing protein [Sphingomonas sp. NSE70-1]|uniref:Winged helix-turn-helix domain-containing protein n=1 Tax=Sphingomonas caseinilyticus TaxID=2908205 RepID=A0ABT0RUN7_9SPHN|nr:winged helix-turn-helix domain-containing protein [Sphingomonas caseinilyticus]MCL6698710.1 winged helix-turn-helix domain-containing protein [Sphingomonas caseinilyticus]